MFPVNIPINKSTQRANKYLDTKNNNINMNRIERPS
jgi:hypothetical protein